MSNGTLLSVGRVYTNIANILERVDQRGQSRSVDAVVIRDKNQRQCHFLHHSRVVLDTDSWRRTSAFQLFPGRTTAPTQTTDKAILTRRFS